MTASSPANSQKLSAQAELEQRRKGIAKCTAWVNKEGATVTSTSAKKKKSSFRHVHQSDLFCFETTLEDTAKSSDGEASSSYKPPMVGVYALKPISKGTTLLTIPQHCILSPTHPLLQDINQEVAVKALTVYRDHVMSLDNQYSPFDPFIANKGRILTDEDLNMALVLTLLLYAHHHPIRTTNGHKKGTKSTPKKSALQKAHDHWESYWDTLPGDYSSLIVYWTQEEIDNLQGTSCHALATRLRTEVQDNWDHCFRDVLAHYLKNEYHQNNNNNHDDKVDLELLQKCYMDGICGCYSRVYGTASKNNNDTTTSAAAATASSSPGRSLCPLMDLFNGNRDTSADVNIHVVRYPGTHMALVTCRDVAEGEELMIPYGNFSHQIFLTVFGFLPLASACGKYPQMMALDAVYVLPPPHLVGDAQDPKWEAYARQGKPLQRKHMMEDPPYVTSQVGTPFALLGNRLDMEKVRTDEDYLPDYLVNFHVFATTSLLKKEDLYITSEDEVDYLAPWQTGAFLLEMMDYRLQQYPSKGIAQDTALLQKQRGNLKTGTLYRILERDILLMWRHAVAKQYGVYGKPRNGVGNPAKNDKDDAIWKKWIQEQEVCATCQTSTAGPLKMCTRCKSISYCGRNCQVEDWKLGGHKQACHSKP